MPSRLPNNFLGCCVKVGTWCGQQLFKTRCVGDSGLGLGVKNAFAHKLTSVHLMFTSTAGHCGSLLFSKLLSKSIFACETSTRNSCSYRTLAQVALGPTCGPPNTCPPKPDQKAIEQGQLNTVRVRGSRERPKICGVGDDLSPTTNACKHARGGGLYIDICSMCNEKLGFLGRLPFGIGGQNVQGI